MFGQYRLNAAAVAVFFILNVLIAGCGGGGGGSSSSVNSYTPTPKLVGTGSGNTFMISYSPSVPNDPVTIKTTSGDYATLSITRKQKANYAGYEAVIASDKANPTKSYKVVACLSSGLEPGTDFRFIEPGNTFWPAIETHNGSRSYMEAKTAKIPAELLGNIASYVVELSEDSTALGAIAVSEPCENTVIGIVIKD